MPDSNRPEPGDRIRPLGNDDVYVVSRTMRNDFGQTFLSAYRETADSWVSLFIDAAQVVKVSVQ